MPQTGFSCKFIFIQSAKSALLTEKFKVRDCVIQKTVAEFGLVFVEFGKMEGKASQGRNPRGCKHINQKSRSKRQRGKWPKLGGWGERLWEIRPSGYRGNVTESGKPGRDIRIYCGRLQVTLVCFGGE